jgi:hypothetical protein
MSALPSASSDSQSTEYAFFKGSDDQDAPYLWGNPASSILGRKSRSLKTRVDDGTSDSPT